MGQRGTGIGGGQSGSPRFDQQGVQQAAGVYGCAWRAGLRLQCLALTADPIFESHAGRLSLWRLCSMVYTLLGVVLFWGELNFLHCLGAAAVLGACAGDHCFAFRSRLLYEK
eukprot:1160854-Pelagomonas_calceolata.AAC.7